MSTDSNEPDCLDAELLNRYRLSAPSPGLRNRVLRAAHEAAVTPETVSSDVSWRVPIFRLAASVALTLILVRLANSAERRSRAPWLPTPQATAPASPLTAAWSCAGATPFAAFAVSLSEKNQLYKLRDHIRRIQELLSTFEG